jgi:hypothetical protein
MDQPTARKRKSPEISELDNIEHIDPDMTVNDFMESQMNRFAAQIRKKANTLTTQLKCDFDASKFDYMEKLDEAASALSEQQKCDRSSSLFTTPNESAAPVVPSSSDVANISTTTTTTVTSSTISNQLNPPIPSTSSSASSSSASSSSTSPDSSTDAKSTAGEITTIILTVVDKEPEDDQEEISNPYQGKVFQLAYSSRRRYLIGRAKSMKYTEKGISLSEDSEVSTSHGDIRTQKGKICFVDFDSTNGSYVNGEKVKPHMYNPLQSGDLLSLGATKMLVTFA